MKYALLQARFGSQDVAMEILKTVYECNVFYQSERCVSLMNTVHLGMSSPT